MTSDPANPARWGQAIICATLGIGLLLAPRWPESGLGVVTDQLLSAILLWPVLSNTAVVLLRRAHLSSVWHAPVALALGGPTAFALSAGIRARSWPAAGDAYLDVLPIVVGIALATAIPTRQSPETVGRPRQQPLRALRHGLTAVALFAVLMGFVASRPDAQEALGGVTWAWRRGMLVAAFTLTAFTLTALGVLVILQWRARPAA